MSQSPEDFPKNRKRIERELRDALKAGGIDIAPQPLLAELVGVVVAECTELRDRVATRIIGPLVGRYENFDDDQLERLGYIVLRHYVDDAGAIQIDFPEPSATDVI